MSSEAQPKTIDFAALRLRRAQEALDKARQELEQARSDWRAQKLPAFVPHHRHLIEAVDRAECALTHLRRDTRA